ncbi:MAG: DUF2189 domain-containing protein [Rhodoferax sp.]|nr:DUF2189 domain-containing protein [Rhodoferax sp.]
MPTVRTVGIFQCFSWLALAWKDLVRAGWASVAHGLVLALFGAALLWVAHQRFWFLAGAFSGFLVVAPVLATSLYALSRALERKESANWAVVSKTWLNWQDSHVNKWGNDYWCMLQFGALLALAATGWVLTSAALITLLSPVPIDTPLDFLRGVVLARDNWVFEGWLALGGVLAAPVFASSVVSMPLLLDRRVSLFQAVLTSWQVVLVNPLPMALWAAVIMGLTAMGFATLMLGLVVVIPLLGHASWHAYRDLVDATALPAREAYSTPYVRRESR